MARLCAFATALSVKNVFFVFLFMKVMSGRLNNTVLSVSMLRVQCSLKLSFPSTLTGVYLQYGLLSTIKSIIIIIIIIIIINEYFARGLRPRSLVQVINETELSLGGSSPYTSTDNTNKNTYT